jgi:beta-N-acetylhexosaminidase
VTAELERQAAACIFASFPGAAAPDWIRAWLARGLGGVVLFADNVADRAQAAGLVASLRAERPELVVAIDEEGGDVTRLEAAGGSSYPGNLALGVVDDVELTGAVGAAIAGELASVGVNMNLAPVADVNSNPLNPVIGVRSFGAEPELVARHVAAFVAGTQARGVAACAKHFPGHGDTKADSHLELPTVESGLAAALVPFRAAIEAGVWAVMTAHILVPEADAEAPATLSEAVVTGLLRGELGFEGVVVSDALDMRAVSATVGVEEGAVRALAAGVDALCLGPSLGADGVERVHRAIVAAVRSERLAAERLAAAADAVRRAGLAGGEVPNEAVDTTIGAVAARRAVRATGDVVLGSAPFVVELRPEPMVAAGRAGYGLGEAIGKRRQGCDVVSLGEPPEDPDAIQRSAEGRPFVVVLRDATRHPWQQSVARALVGARPDTVVVETGLPGWLPEDAAASVETYGAGRVNLEAAADLLAPETLGP